MTVTLGGQAARGTAWLGLVNLVSKGSQVLVTLALGAFLSRSEVGAVSIAVVLVNLGQTLQSMGVYDVVSRTRHDPLEFSGTVAALSVAVAALAGLLLLAGGGLIASWLGAPNAAGPIRVAGIGLPFTAYAGVQFAYLHRRLDFRRRLVPDAGSALAGAMVTIAAAAAGAGVWSLVAGILVTAVLSPLLGLAVGVRIPLRWNAIHLSETIGWARLVGPAAVLGVLLLNIDYVVVTRAFGEEANGLYSYAYRFAYVPYIMIAVVLSGVAFPVYTRLLARAQDSATDRTAPPGRTAPATASVVAPALQRVVHVLVAGAGGLYLLLALLAPRIVVIDGRWAPSAPVLTVLCGYGLLLCLLLAGYDALRAIGRPGLFLAAQAGHLVTLLVLAVLAVTGLGWAADRPAMEQAIVAVACAQVLAAAGVGVAVLVALVRARVVGPATLGVLRGPGLAGAATVALAAGLHAADLAPPTASLPGLVWFGAVLGLVYAGVLVVVDRQALAELRRLRRG